MKVLFLLALAALAAVEAEPEAEADPQLVLNTALPLTQISPIVPVATKEVKPITYTVPSTIPLAAWPYAHNFNTWTSLLPEVGKPAESGRAKREAEADPQLLLNAGIYPWATPYTAATLRTIGAPITSGALPFAHSPLLRTLPIISTPGAIMTVSTSVSDTETTEVARAKREADPQMFINPLVSFNADDTVLPLSYSIPTAGVVPAINPITYSAGAWPATWSAAWSHPGLPIAYTMAKKTE